MSDRSNSSRPTTNERGPCPEGAREIPLTQGQVAWVDEADYERVMAVGSWCAIWCPGTKSFYAQRGVRVEGRKTTQLLHVFLFGVGIDHIDHDTLDNRACATRPNTPSQRQMNRRPQSNNTSGVVGVHWNKKLQKWGAYIDKDRVRMRFGHFADKEDAIAARRQAEIEHFGEYRYRSEADRRLG